MNRHIIDFHCCNYILPSTQLCDCCLQHVPHPGRRPVPPQMASCRIHGSSSMSNIHDIRCRRLLCRPQEDYTLGSFDESPPVSKNKPWFWSACNKIGIKPPGVHTSGPATPTLKPKVGPKEKPPAAPNGWRNFWTKGSLDLRRRKHVGDAAPVEAV